MASEELENKFWELALATNAAFKGLLGSMGESGHICAKIDPVQMKLDLTKSWRITQQSIASEIHKHIDDGDVIVVAEKIVAASQGRIGPREVLLNPDPKTVPPEQLKNLAEAWQKKLAIPIKPIHLLLADEYENNQCTLGALDHNQACQELANTVYQVTGKHTDVIISDTDTGLDTRMPLIGCVTICATPIGATRGLVLYEAMRCAVAAEFARGHTRSIPVVICKPAERRKQRAEIGQHRGYAGNLHITQEKGITHA